MGDSYPSARDLLDDWIDKLGSYDMVSSAEAKKEYFLTASDLSTLMMCSVGGGFLPGLISTGPPTKYYLHEDLVNRSLR